MGFGNCITIHPDNIRFIGYNGHMNVCTASELKKENNSSSAQKAVPIRTPSRMSSDASTKSDHGSFYINDESAAAAANKVSL